MSEDDPHAPIKELLLELAEMSAEFQELQEQTNSVFVRENREIEACQARIDEAARRIDELEAKKREADPQAFEDLATAARDISHKENEIRSACHALPTSLLHATQRIEGFGFRVSVTKATIRREYKPELVRAHPELEHMFLDGDPVITRTIDTAVFDRLVAEGNFDATEAEKFLRETKIRNPQVRIRTADVEDEDEDQ